jgi:hypothetical protein
MKRLSVGQLICLLLPLAIGLPAPSIILLCVQIFVGGVPIAAAVEDVLDGQFANGRNLFMLSVIGLIPFAVLSGILSRQAGRNTVRTLYALCIGGLLGMLGLMVPGHVSVWYPLYGPGRMSSTAVIAFVFIPLYCTATMFVGLGCGHMVSRIRWFRAG